MIGRLLGIAVLCCFATGLYSHYLQEPLDWMAFPTQPYWIYRLTQGIHVATGTAAIPLLLAKLWTVYPRLFSWPMIKSIRHAVERGSIAILVSATVLQLFMGFINTIKWYPWPFSFRQVHFGLAWVTVGSLLIHIAVKLPLIVEHWRNHGIPSSGKGWSRRGFLTATTVATGLVVATTVGQSVNWLGRAAVLSPRKPHVGPQGLPINRTAAQADVLATATSAKWQLLVRGPRTVSLSLAELEALPQHKVTLPISCVEGWSQNADWTGVRIRELLELVDTPTNATVTVSSLERDGHYRTSELSPEFIRDDRTLLALRLGNETLHIEHGYPARIIAPGRPGVLQTKWVQRIEVNE